VHHSGPEFFGILDIVTAEKLPLKNDFFLRFYRLLESVSKIAGQMKNILASTLQPGLNCSTMKLG